MKNTHKKQTILNVIIKEFKRQKKLKELKADYAFGVDNWENDEYLKKIENQIKALKKR